MIMNCDQYTGKCVCGHEHTLETKMVVVEYNALANFEKYMEAVGLAGKRRTVVYDTNVYRLTEGKHLPCDQEIVLDANGLRSEDILIEKMMKDAIFASKGDDVITTALRNQGDDALRLFMDYLET